ncbi:hypothetical protein FXS52_05285, partial [Salmonella enterica subsp. enterica]|nr:hypothetical protein [Salmonella enterica subsp. enterica serovar Salford]
NSGKLTDIAFEVLQFAVHFYLWGCFLARPPPEKPNMMNKKHTNHHLLKINNIKTEGYNMMMMHEKSKMRQIPRRCRPVAWLTPGSTF